MIGTPNIRICAATRRRKNPPASVLRIENCVQFFGAEVTGMSAGEGGGIDKATLEGLIVGSGVRPTSEELDAVARALARIRTAAATLSQSPSFDETAERFYRLLETDAADGAAG
jgi:hypothetical protein